MTTYENFINNRYPLPYDPTFDVMQGVLTGITTVGMGIGAYDYATTIPQDEPEVWHGDGPHPYSPPFKRLVNSLSAGRTGALTGNATHITNGNMSTRQRRERKGQPKRKGTPNRPRRPPPPRRSGAQVQRTVAPLNMGTRVNTRDPVIKNTAGGGMSVAHSELVYTVTTGATTDWQLLYSAHLQPASSTSFPWLSRLAVNFDIYKFGFLRYSFVPLRSAASDGQLIFSVDYDSRDEAPTSIVDMSQMSGTTTSSCWQPGSIGMLPSRMQAIATGRNGTKPTRTAGDGTDRRMTDSGIVYIASDGCAATTVLGHIWVHYVAHLSIPQGGVVDATVLSSKLTGGGTMAAGAPFGTDATELGDRIEYDNATGIITFREHGHYILVLRVVGTGLTTATVTSVGGAYVSSNQVTNSTSTTCMHFVVCDVLAGDTIQYTMAVATTVTGSVLRVATYDYAFGTKYDMPIRNGIRKQWRDGVPLPKIVRSTVPDETVPSDTDDEPYDMLEHKSFKSPTIYEPDERKRPPSPALSTSSRSRR
jgi:hypothetical protein